MAFPSPSLAPPALNPWQLSYRGLTFGGVTPGSAYQLQTLTMDMPDVASGDVQRAVDQGEFIGMDVLPGADITLQQVVTGVAAAYTPGPTQLPVLTNEASNPSFGYDTVGSTPAGWSTSSPLLYAAPASFTAVTTSPKIGTQCAQIVTNTANSQEGVATLLQGRFQAGTPYTCTLYLRGNAGGETVRVDFGAANADRVSQTFTPTTSWQRFTLPTWTPASSTSAVYLLVGELVNAAYTFFVDGVMVIAGAAVQPYADGDTPGWYWIGTPGDSASSNAPQPVGGPAITLDQAVQALGGVMAPGGAVESPLWLCTPAGTFVRMCRPRKHNCPIDINRVFAQAAVATSMLHSTDPRWYAAPTQSQTVGLPAMVAGGLTFSSSGAAFPAVFAAGSATNVVNVANSGLFESRPVLIVTGPCTNPVITNTSIAGAPWVGVNQTLNTGDTLTIDMDWRSVVLRSAGSTFGAPRRNAIMQGSTWWNLPASSSNVVEFTSSDIATVGGTLTIRSASAYLSL